MLTGKIVHERKIRAIASCLRAFELQSFPFAASLSLFALTLVGQAIAVNGKQLVRQRSTDTPNESNLFRHLRNRQASRNVHITHIISSGRQLDTPLDVSM